MYAAKRVDRSTVHSTIRCSNTYENELLPKTKMLLHANIITILYTELRDFDCWIILEYCEHTLCDFLKIKNLTPDHSKSIIFQAACGIEYLHFNRIAHRDVKPNNILIQKHSDWPWVKVTDFSLARDLSKECTSYMTTVRGNKHWMAPELLDEEGNYAVHLLYKCIVDIYSLGLVFAFVCMRQEGREYLLRKIICEHISYFHLNDPCYLLYTVY